ncbi:MAG: hypothetical protein ACRCXZ_09195, partial [Patescibacteria group bacterium]
MSRFFLIHGYGTGAQYAFLKVLGPDAGYNIFDELLFQKAAYLYDWRIYKKYSFFDCLNIRNYYTLYREEGIKALSEINLLNLNTRLIEQDPEVIICHSMGCKMILSYFEGHRPNPKLQSIVLLQGDFDAWSSIPKYLMNTE